MWNNKVFVTLFVVFNNGERLTDDLTINEVNHQNPDLETEHFLEKYLILALDTMATSHQFDLNATLAFAFLFLMKLLLVLEIQNHKIFFSKSWSTSF